MPILRVVIIFCLLITTQASVYANVVETSIEKVIVGYNQGIIKAARTSKTDHMKAYAKDDIVKKFHLWIMSWHDNNLFMDAKIVDINFKNIKVDGDKAFVITDEKWIYKYIDIKVRKEVHKKTSIMYTMKYTLVKEDDKWVIQKIDVLSEKQNSVKA